MSEPMVCPHKTACRHCGMCVACVEERVRREERSQPKRVPMSRCPRCFTGDESIPHFYLCPNAPQNGPPNPARRGAESESNVYRRSP